jgi:hypothetical protein
MKQQKTEEKVAKQPKKVVFLDQLPPVSNEKDLGKEQEIAALKQ